MESASNTANAMLQPALPQARTSALGPLDPSSCLFFARAPPDASGEQLVALFSKYGTVKDINLYRRWPTAKQSKGCGTVQFADPESAAAALQALNGSHKFPGSDTPLVVEWLDFTRQTKPPKQSSGKDALNTARDQYRYVNHNSSAGANPLDDFWSSPLPAGTTDPYTLPALLAMMSMEMLKINAQAAAVNSAGPTAPQRRHWATAHLGSSVSHPGDASSWSMANPGYAARNRRSSCPYPGSFGASASAHAAERRSSCSFNTAAQSAPGATLTAHPLLMLQQNMAVPAQQGQMLGATLGIPATAALHGAVGTYGMSSIDGSYASAVDCSAPLPAGSCSARSYILPASNNAHSPQATEGLYSLGSLDSDMLTPTAASSLPCPRIGWLMQQQDEAQFVAATTAAPGVHGVAIDDSSNAVTSVPEHCIPMICSAGRPDTTLAPTSGLHTPSNNEGMWEQQPLQQELDAELVVHITPEILGAIGASLPHIATLSGASIQARAQAGVAGGLVLALTGSAAARDMASRLICAVVEQPLPTVQVSTTCNFPLSACDVI